MEGNPFSRFLAELTERQTVLDLGCGPGSFHYELYNCRIIGMDLSVPQRPQCPHAAFVQADSAAIPLEANSVDAVVCHHTLEHFGNFRATLTEMNRILRDDGLIWIAIPNGYSFDDKLYRLVFSGGGHVNRFSRDRLIAEVHQLTRFRLVQSVDLFSSFIYLKKPTEQEYRHYPRTARFLFHIPDETGTGAIFAINAVTRVIDKLFGCRFSQYGWGFVFAREGASLPPLQLPYFNVCSKCGSGIPARRVREDGDLRQFCGLGFFHCPNCRQLNAFVSPPGGCE